MIVSFQRMRCWSSFFSVSWSDEVNTSTSIQEKHHMFIWCKDFCLKIYHSCSIFCSLHSCMFNGHSKVLRKDSGSSTQGRIESLELREMRTTARQPTARMCRMLNFKASISQVRCRCPDYEQIKKLFLGPNSAQDCFSTFEVPLAFWVLRGVGEEPTLSSEVFPSDV